MTLKWNWYWKITGTEIIHYLSLGNKRNTIVATSGTSTAYSFGTPEIIPGFYFSSCCSICGFLVVFCRSLIVLLFFLRLVIVLSVLFRFTTSDYPFCIFKLLFCFPLAIVLSVFFFIYGFRLPRWYNETFLLLVVRNFLFISYLTTNWFGLHYIFFSELKWRSFGLFRLCVIHPGCDFCHCKNKIYWTFIQRDTLILAQTNLVLSY